MVRQLAFSTAMQNQVLPGKFVHLTLAGGGGAARRQLAAHSRYRRLRSAGAGQRDTAHRTRAWQPPQ
ncbi:MAG: hypothetical protein DMF24_04730 [Verrucomicrobia bacterium]|nr:MAG: hypothetical protein DME90_06465 [Verrucomicrobiota bacterium]PYL62258.1 MAG: hypothetical protein DMF24_04730 [Verrucomicrobiota bacterium]